MLNALVIRIKIHTFIWMRYSLALVISPAALAFKANDLSCAIASSVLLDDGTDTGSTK